MGSSVGISKCRNRSDLLEGLMDAARYDRRVLVEEFIDAREVEVSILGNDRPMASCRERSSRRRFLLLRR